MPKVGPIRPCRIGISAIDITVLGSSSHDTAASSVAPTSTNNTRGPTSPVATCAIQATAIAVTGAIPPPRGTGCRCEERWFGEAVRQGPSLPFGYSEWGQALLAKGDVGRAIAKLSLAHDKGPHFADPLEMWGEALAAKGEPGNALEKFVEADRYAPNWGRLHLKWGEALAKFGDGDGAKTQFAIARGLELTAAERAELRGAKP